MKKIQILILMTLVMTSCKTKNNSKMNYKYVIPTGAPAIAMSCFSNLENFETIVDPSKILPMMVSDQVDICALPTNVGISAIHDKNVPFKMLGTITFGNFYIASTGNDTDGKLDENDYIVSFQKGAVPDKIFHYVYGNELDNALHYVSSAQEAAKCLMLGKNLADDSKDVDYVLIAEPALTTVMKKSKTVSVFSNIQDEYKKKSGGLSIFQASIFVKNSINASFVHDTLQSKIESSINEMLNTDDAVIKYMNQANNPEAVFGVNPEIAEEITIHGNKLGLGFELASNNKEGINLFLSLFGIEGINDEDIA